MSEIYPQDLMQYLPILYIAIRLGGVFLCLQFFSSRVVPWAVRGVLILALALVLFPLLKDHLPPVENSVPLLGLYAIREFGVGCLMGFAAQMTVEGFNLAAQFIGFQMGWGSASLMDPQTQSNVSILVPLQGWLALLVFLILDMHYGVLELFVQSYEIIGGSSENFALDPKTALVLITAVGKVFVIAVQMAAPFTLVILLVNMAMGMVARLLPQMNVMLMSFPVTITVTLVVMYFLTPDLLNYVENRMGDISADVVRILKSV